MSSETGFVTISVPNGICIFFWVLTTIFFCPFGIKKYLAPISALAPAFSNIPPTGPIEPSGFIVPVIIVSLLVFIHKRADKVATVNDPPADGPPIIGASDLIV